MLPLLLEDFLDNREKDFIELLHGKKDVSSVLYRMRKDMSVLEDDILSSKEVSEKLSLFVDYIEKIEKLPEGRVKIRVSNGLKMIEKMREWFLVEKLECDTGGMPPDLPVRYAKGVGPGREKNLKKLGLKTLGDLLNYFPRDYEDRRKIVRIKDLIPGQRLTTKGKLLSVELKKLRGLKLVVAILGDGIHQILLKWFNQEYMYDQIKELTGKDVFVTGNVKRGMFNQLEMANPEVVPAEKVYTKEILPIYRLTSGISQKTFRKIMRENIPRISCSLKETLPEVIVKKRNFLDIKSSYFGIHFPKTFYNLRKSRKRLAYEEFFYLQLALLLSRKEEERIGGIPKEIKGILAKEFIKKLPFELTKAQMRVHEEIRKDMMSKKPMNRLLQGDVGSGKTVVAQLAMIDNCEAGYQSALMAPTSILAIQHFRRTQEAFSDMGIRVALILGATPQAEKRKIKSLLKSGEIDVVIGTHALIQEDVHFKRLGLVIIDEQHRFGVRQREALMSKGKLVDTLVMTATPIPRTLALTVYGDLDVSIIDEMPPGRKAVRTLLVSASRVEEVFEFVKEEVKKGNQAFIVYPLIEESEKINVKSAVEMYEHLSKEVFPEFKVALLHGRMSQEEKDDVMLKFSKGDYDILVSTTVIEVGIDVPKASIMVIENPERFGLAQLHQLRGRVGRSGQQAYCFLIVGDVDEDVMERLQFFASTSDGFEIAEYDMKVRGPGELLGLRQHGLPDFKVADLIEDQDVLLQAREDAMELLSEERVEKKYSYILERIKILYGERLKLLEVG